MTYREICLFIQKKLFEKEQPLKKEDLKNYYSSIKKDPFLKAVMDIYPPYSRRWEIICPSEHQVFLRDFQYTKDVHVAAAQMDFTKALEYVEKKYQIQTLTGEQKVEEAKSALNEVELQLKTGYYNNLLESEERHRRWTKARDGAQKRGEIFCARMVEPCDSVEKILADLIDYIGYLRSYLSVSALILDELIYLKRWVAEAENTPSSKELIDRWAAVIVCLDESRTSNFLDNSLVYSCAKGTMERLQTRLYYIAVANDPSPSWSLEYSLVEQLIMPFVYKDPQEVTRYHPTNLLYDIYLKACDFEISSTLKCEYHRKILHHKDRQSYYALYNDYLQDSPNIGNPEHQRELFHRIVAQSPFKPFEERSLLEKKILDTLYEKSYKKESCLQSIIAAGSQKLTDQQIIARMADIIGFGLEHVELLLSIVGQYFYTYYPLATPTLPGLDYLEICASNGFTYLSQDELLQSPPLWDKKKAEESYLIYLNTRPEHLSNYPLVTLMPDGLASQHIYRDCLSHMECIAENELDYDGCRNYINAWDCSYDLFSRLITTGHINFHESALNLLLEYFCQNGHERSCLALIKHTKANVNQIRKARIGYSTPLLRAIMADQYDIFLYIVSNCDIKRIQYSVGYVSVPEYLYNNGKKHFLELLIQLQKVDITVKDSSGTSFLEKVIRKKDKDFAKKVMAIPSVRGYLEQGTTIREIFCAIETEQWDLAQELGNLSKPDGVFFQYYFYRAVELGENKVATKMLRHSGIKLTIFDKVEHKPLWYALKVKDLTLQHLILNYAYINFDEIDIPNTVIDIIHAIQNYNTGIETLNFLLRCSPCPLSGLKDIDGHPLIFMVLRRYINTRDERYRSSTANWLLDQFLADPNNINIQNFSGQTPIMLLIRSDHNSLEKCFFLLQKFPNIDIDQQDNLNNTALIYALEEFIKLEETILIRSYNRCSDVIQALISKGANLNHCNDSQKSVLSLAVRSEYLFDWFLQHPGFNPQKQHKPISDIIFDFLSIIINENTENRLLPLSYISLPNIALLLKDQRVNPNAQNSDGNTALMIALNMKNDLFVTLLSNNRIDINISNNNGDTVLMIAVKNNDQRALDILRRKNININAQNIEGNTALMLAAQNGNCTFIRNIIAYDRGCLWSSVDFNIKNKQGETALDQALTVKSKNLIFDQAHPILGRLLKPFFFSQHQGLTSAPVPQNLR